MKYIIRFASYIAVKNEGEFIWTVFHVFAYYVLFNLFEASIEKIFFGHAFEHILDYLFLILWLVFLLICLSACSSYNRLMHQKNYKG